MIALYETGRRMSSHPAFRATLLMLERGTSRLPLRTLMHGEPMVPISVGGEGDWCVHASGVEPEHLFLDFDGETVHVCPAGPAGVVFLNGARLEGWAAAPVTSEIRFGAACLHVGLDDAPAPAPELSPPPGYGKTQILNAEQLEPLRRLLRDPAARDREPLAVEVPVHRCLTIGPAIPPGATPTPEPLTRKETPRPSPRALFESTLCDGGALRDLAARAVEAASASNEIAPPDQVAPPSGSTGSGFLRRSSADALAKLWTRASRSRRAALLVLPILLAVALWPRAPRGSARSSPVAGPTQVAASAPAARPPAPSHSASSAAVTPAARGPNGAGEPREASSPLERRALVRAFEGALSEAADSYAELAQRGEGARVFEAAARASRSGAVRRP